MENGIYNFKKWKSEGKRERSEQMGKEAYIESRDFEMGNWA